MEVKQEIPCIDSTKVLNSAHTSGVVFLLLQAVYIGIWTALIVPPNSVFYNPPPHFMCMYSQPAHLTMSSLRAKVMSWRGKLIMLPLASHHQGLPLSSATYQLVAF